MQQVLLKIMVRFFALLPFGLLYFLSGLLRWLLQRVFRYRTGVVEANLHKAFPEKNEAEIQQITDDFYARFSDVLLESVKGFSLSKTELQRRFHYRNPEIFIPFFEKKQSVLLLGGHYGNWEWGVLSFPLAVQHRVVGIFKPLKNKKVQATLNRLRTRWGLHLANSHQAGRAIVEHRDVPTIFVLIADQTPSDMKNAHWLPFFHQDTPFLQGPARLARQTGYPVFIFDIERTGRGFYEVTFREVCADAQDLEPEAITALYARQLEEIIRREPGAWLWSHRRWKRKKTYRKNYGLEEKDNN